MKSSLKQYSREAAVLAALFLLIIIFSMIEPVYLTPSNMIDIIKQGTINGILAIGITFAIISGGIDLSIGCTFAIVIVTVGQLTVEKVPTLIALSAGAILGGIMGSLNGLLITKLKLQPFIATLGTMSVYRGLAYVFTGGWPVLGIPDTYRKTFTTKLFWDIPVSILVLFAIAILTHIVLSKTRFGNYLYAVGGNEEASKLSGVDVDKTKIISYAICGACAAFAGMIMLANLGTGEPASGQGYELDAIAAAAVGGTRMTGGKGSILGTVLGALLLAALKIGMIVIGVQTFYQFIVTGIIIIIAAYFEFIQDSIVAKLSKKS
ncbi:ribose ABC transporter permease [Anaerolineaceae bacterium oral taxon 439]|nr:ribose ABC transporter permease [Anaerolineaceae bacterium oral taxon 439]